MLVRTEWEKIPYTEGGNVNVVPPQWKSLWRLLQILEKEVPHDPSILFLGMYPKGPKSSYHTQIHLCAHHRCINPISRK